MADQFRQINGPDGPINFPSNMSDDQVTQAMRRLYPPKQAAPTMQERVGSMVPDWAVSPLETADKYLVQPFEKAAAWGAHKGGQIYEQGVAALPGTGVGSGNRGVNPLLFNQSSYEQQHQVTSGISKGIGETVGGMATDPRNWPFMASSSARPILQKLITTGFGAMMAQGTISGAKHLHDQWDDLTPHERAEMATQVGISGAMTAMSAAHLKENAKAHEVPIKKDLPIAASGKMESEAKAETTPPINSSPKTGSSPVLVGPSPVFETPLEAPKPVTSLAGARANLTSPPESGIMVGEGEEKPVFTPRDLQQSLPNKPVPKLGTTPKLELVRPPDTTRLITDRMMQLRRQGLTDPEQVFKLTQEFPDKAEDIIRGYKAQQVPKETPSTPQAIQPKESVQAAAASAKAGEPVPSTSRPSVDTRLGQREPRSERGNSLPGLDVFNKRVAEMLKKSPGMAEGSARRLVAEEIRKEQGAISLGGNDDVPQRRERKINSWMDRLRDPNIQQDEALRMIKNLKAYGLDNDEIVRRMSGAKDFAKSTGFSGESKALNGLPEDLKRFHEELRKNKLSAQYFMDTPSHLRQSFFDQYVINREGIAKGKYGFGDIVDSLKGHPDNLDDYLANQSLEERIGDPKTFSHDDMDDLSFDKGLSAPVDRVMGKYTEGTDARLQYQAGLEGKLTGESKIEGVKDPAIQELDNIFRQKDPRTWEREDERGSFSLRSTKGKAPPGGGIPPVQSSLADLTQKLESSLKAIPPDDSRMRIMERLDKATTEGWDKVQMSIGRMAAQAVALKDMYFREPEMTDYRSAIGRFSGALNRSAWELRQFTKEIKAKLPDALRREAVTNWIQADGDDKVLADRSARSKGSVRAGYEAARNLTQEELHLASFIQQHFENRLKEAINMGILKDGLENYVPQIWKPKDQTKAGNFFSSLHRSGLLKPDFNSAKKRLFESYFEGEQAGRTPVNKDIGFLLASWDKALNQSIASRNLIRDLSYGLAKDGRPIIAPSGTGKPAYDSNSPLEGDKPNAYYIYPKAGPDETGDYVALNHSALTKWIWATKDENGTPIFMKGDLRVHPDHAQTLDNIINRGKWAAAHPIQTAILKGQGFFKQTLLAASPFHQIQEGTHALFHKVNPFNPKPIDLTNPDMGKLLDHGLVIGSYDPVGAFEEGVSSGGAVGKIPGLGRFMQKYTDYLFQDYIPRLKANMATEAYARNMERYSDHIAQGKITSDQIAELTANQANAAFGELNYMMMGRSPQTQAILRMMFLAPDFLEARARFVGQALRPKGREQYAALFRGALGMYTTARILNQLLDNDPHWDKPFSLIVHGFEYKIRSLPGDIWHMLDDHNSFIMHRLNPTLVKPLYEFASGKDDFGRKRTLGEQALDAARGVVPISAQGFMKSGNETIVDGLLSGLGVTRSKFRTKAGALAHQYAIGSIPNDITSHHVADLVNDIQNGTIDSNKIGTLLREGKMNPADFVKARNLARLPELYRDYHRLPVEQKAKVWMAATTKERALLRRYSSKELDVTKLLPEQREEFMQHFSDP